MLAGGKKETQFHGSLGKEAAKIKIEVILFDMSTLHLN